MAISSQTILASRVAAGDGLVGQVRDLLFDVRRWQVRHLVVETGAWLHGRRVLLPAALAERADWLNHELGVAATRRQIDECPPVNAAGPLARADEAVLARHYGCGGALTGEKGESGGGELGSCVGAIGTAVEARDGRAGSVEDFIVDDAFGGARAWELRYLVVEVGGLLRRKRVLLTPTRVERADWDERTLFLARLRKEILEGPEFDPGEPVNPEAETRLYDYYGLPKSWREKD